ncbi:MAG: hypothetical protein ACODAD_09980 [Planctomycetota bacterium]
MLLRIIQLGRIRLWWRSIVVAGGLLAGMIVAWCLPAVLGSQLLWPHVVSHLTSDLEARVTTESVALGWFAPVVVRKVRVENISGESVATVEAIRSEATLLSLLFGGGDFGTVFVEGPDVELRLRADGSNLEDLIASYSKRPGSAAESHGTIRVTDAGLTVKVPHERRLKAARFDSIGAVIKVTGGEQNGGSIDLQSRRLPSGGSEGSLESTVSWQRAGNSTNWSLAANIRRLDLSVLQLFARRLDLRIGLEGRGSFEGDATWNSDTDRVMMAVRHANLQGLRLSAPDYLGQDELEFERVRAHGTCHVTGNTWTLASSELECDAGHLAVDGTFVWPVSESDWLGRLAATAQAAELEVAGQLDLARLATTLPHILHIRQGTVVESGTMTFRLAGQNQEGERDWITRVETSQLAARRDGEQYTWNSPLKITAQATRKSDKWHIEQLACTSSFLSLTGKATATAGSFELQCDLNQLSDQLREFVDLGSVQAAGTMSGRLNWEREDTEGLTIHGTGLLEELELNSDMTGHWHEPRLSVTLAAKGEQSEQEPTVLRTARLALSGQGDRLEMQLLEPVKLPNPNGALLFGCYVSGQWATWFPRLRPLLPSAISDNAWSVAGPIDAELTLRMTTRSIAIEEGSLASNPFTLDSPRLRIDEPAIGLEVKGRWDFADRRLRVPELTFQTRAMAFRMSDLRINRDNRNARTTGEVTFRADLDRLHESWHIPGKQHDWKLSGSVEGQVSVVQPSDTAQTVWRVDLVGLELDRRQLAAPTDNVVPAMNSSSWVTVWREPVLNLTGSGQYTFSSKTILLDRFKLKSPDKLQLSMHGSMSEPIGACEVDLQGQVTYDLGPLLEHWAPQLTKGVEWSGHDTQPFSLRGPLFQVTPTHAGSGQYAAATASAVGMIPSQLQGQCGLSWQSANLFGLRVGAGAVNAQLERGTMALGVVETPISSGKMRIQSAIHLNHQPPMISLAPGPVLTDVRITTDMCDQWLKYVAPVVAAATRAEGQFSLSLEHTLIPLRQPSAAQVEGTLNVHASRIGPGPLAQELILLANNARSMLQLDLKDFSRLGQDTWLRFPQQQTKCHVSNQRVYHDQLEFEVGKVKMYTHGSVGFDQSLSLMVRIPLQDQWISGNPQLTALQGQVIEVPVGGTLSEPRVDQRALERLAAKTLRQASGRLIENELNNALQRLMESGR